MDWPYCGMHGFERMLCTATCTECTAKKECTAAKCASVRDYPDCKKTLTKMEWGGVEEKQECAAEKVNGKCPDCVKRKLIGFTDWLDLNGRAGDGCEGQCESHRPGCCPMETSLGTTTKAQCGGRLCVPVEIGFSTKPPRAKDSAAFAIDMDKLEGLDRSQGFSP